MERRFVIVLVALVLSLAALVAAGLYIGMAPAAVGIEPQPQPAPCPVAERPQAPSALSADGAVALGPLAPEGMSGEFAKRLFADAGPLGAPSICRSSDSQRLGSPQRTAPTARCLPA
jgi:hypothetical protein